jgi:hypothetical protein
MLYDEPTRSIANRIIERLHQDEAFRDQLRADPVGSLTSNGLPEDAVGDFLGAIKFQGEVSGYMRSTHDHCKCWGWPPPSGCVDLMETSA